MLQNGTRLPYARAMKTTPSPTAVPGRDLLLAEIRGAGLRATASRVAVLRVLHEQHRPMSHSEVVGELSQHTWDPSTLYRNLCDLADAGLVRRSELGDRTWRFEVSCDHGHADHTAHFLCRDCGVIACLPELSVVPKGGQPLPIALTQGTIEVQILGQCDTCFAAA